MAAQDTLITILAYGIVFISLILISLMLFFHYSRKKIVQKELEKIGLQLDSQKNMVKAIIATQEEERKRIAQDMHDAISAKLNVVGLTANMMLDDETLSIDQKESLGHIVTVTTNTLSSARRIAHDLLPPVLDKFGLKVALEELVEDFLKTNKIQIHHTIEDFPSMAKDSRLHVFRIVQELFNNAIRHGKATQVTLEMVQIPAGFSLHFKDNGSGFNTAIVEGVSGLGMENIKSRASMLQAHLEVKSTIGKDSIFNIKSMKDGI